MAPTTPIAQSSNLEEIDQQEDDEEETASTFSSVIDENSVDNVHDNQDWIDMAETLKCTFCNQLYRKQNRRFQKLSHATTSNKRSQIYNILVGLNKQNLNDFDDFDKSTVHYHTTCFNDHRSRFERQITPQKSQQDVSKQSVHSTVFSKLFKNLNDSLIQADEVRALSDIYNTYKAIFEEEKESMNLSSSETVFRSQYLLDRILKHLPSLTKTVFKYRTYVHKSTLDNDKIFTKIFELQCDWSVKIKEVAFYIRQCAVKMDVKTLPKRNIMLTDIIRGECEIPKELKLLVGSLLKGPKGANNSIKEKKIECICSSVILAMFNGRVKPAAAIQLGMAIKSLSGSRKVLDILNRMGHSISYTVVEELETELAYGGSIRQLTLPEGLIAGIPELNTHIAFDNYDRYVK